MPITCDAPLCFKMLLGIIIPGCHFKIPIQMHGKIGEYMSVTLLLRHHWCEASRPRIRRAPQLNSNLDRVNNTHVPMFERFTQHVGYQVK
jgi:hypothetical protein